MTDRARATGSSGSGRPLSQQRAHRQALPSNGLRSAKERKRGGSRATQAETQASPAAISPLISPSDISRPAARAARIYAISCSYAAATPAMMVRLARGGLVFVALALLPCLWQRTDSVSLERYLQDPLPVPEFNISTRSPLVTVRGRFWELQLHGLSATRLERATANLTGQTVELATLTDLVSLRGQYVVSGDFAFVAIRGNGTFWMNATNAVASARAELERGPGGGPWVREVSAKLDVDDIQLHMENLMGGGRWSTFSNSLLNQISGNVFKQVNTFKMV